MTAAKKLNLVSVDDYLTGELVSPVKHEYLGGVIYAMAGARNAHNTIGGNVFGSLHFRLRGKRCRPFNSDTKVRVHLPNQIRFYYPDTQVSCRPNPRDDSFQGFVREVYEGLDAVVPLSEIETDLPLAEIYDGMEFAPEPEEEQ